MQGIYIIKNLINNKVYIGKAKNIEKRWLVHKMKFRTNTKKYLYAAMVKYGIENFEFSTLKETNSDLDDWEKYYIQKYNSNNRKFGYNQTIGGDGGDIYSFKSLEEQQNISEKISKKLKLADHSWKKGYKRAKEIGEKHSKNMKNFWANCSDEFKKERSRKLSEANKGKSHPAWNKGLQITNDQKEKISKAFKGRKYWTNGIENKFQKECPGDGWELGRIQKPSPLKGKTKEEIFGKERAKEISIKISKSLIGQKRSAKKVFCENLNKYFDSVLDAGKFCNISVKSIRLSCNTGKYIKGMLFRWNKLNNMNNQITPSILEGSNIGEFR